MGKQICCIIMMCQMTAILSGVAIMYLSVIVVIPSNKELAYNFVVDPIMCTTVQAIDIAAGGIKIECPWSTCGEWCLSQAASPCMQIYTMPRRIGDPVELQDCDIITKKPCSALDPELTNQKLCRKGECKDLNGLHNCTKIEENACKDISSAYNCSKFKMDPEGTKCSEEKCTKRLDGVYHCDKGDCHLMLGTTNYHDCKRKCEELKLAEGNTILFTSKLLYVANCKAINSTGNNSLNDLNENVSWRNNVGYTLMMFCSYAEHSPDTTNVNLNLKDCFNASLRNRNQVADITSYLKLISYRNRLDENTKWLIDPEETLRLMNDTKLMINAEGCSNTLSKECTKFFETHATDGKDGLIPDRYPCFYTEQTNEFVIGLYDPEKIYMMFMITSIGPACLFVFSCFCLFLFSKSVGVDEIGNLKVKLPGSKGKGGAPGDSMIEMEL